MIAYGWFLSSFEKLPKASVVHRQQSWISSPVQGTRTTSSDIALDRCIPPRIDVARNSLCYWVVTIAKSVGDLAILFLKSCRVFQWWTFLWCLYLQKDPCSLHLKYPLYLSDTNKRTMQCSGRIELPYGFYMLCACYRLLFLESRGLGRQGLNSKVNSWILCLPPCPLFDLDWIHETAPSKAGSRDTAKWIEQLILRFIRRSIKTR